MPNSSSSSSSSGAARLKALLRAELRRKLAALSSAQLHAESVGAVLRAVRTPEFVKARAVAVFLSTNAEVQTRTLLQHVFDAHKRCYCPRMCGRRRMEMVQVFSLADVDAFERGRFGIAEPPVDDARRHVVRTAADLDLVFVPGVAFDAAGGRLGHGLGCYDAWFDALRRQSPSLHSMPTLFALALRCQIVDEVPVENHDVAVDRVICAGEDWC